MLKTATVIMSPPDFFKIEYSINPWMDTSNIVHKEHAMREWNSLKDTYTSLGLEIKIIHPKQGFPDLVFTTDHGVFIGDTFYISRFRYSERQGEQNITIPWYKKQSIKLQEIPSVCFMEGGDVLFSNKHIFLGYGFRTSDNTAEFLHNTSRYPVTSLELVDEAFYHLDTCFLPVSSDTAFYYPQAFGSDSIKSLKRHFDILIPLSSHEAEAFACNSVIIDKHVICQPNPTFEQKISELGFTPTTLEMHEFNKSGGGIHCLSQIIE